LPFLALLKVRAEAAVGVTARVHTQHAQYGRIILTRIPRANHTWLAVTMAVTLAATVPATKEAITRTAGTATTTETAKPARRDERGAFGLNWLDNESYSELLMVFLHRPCVPVLIRGS
jgi:hypothetical protein